MNVIAPHLPWGTLFLLFLLTGMAGFFKQLSRSSREARRSGRKRSRSRSPSRRASRNPAEIGARGELKTRNELDRHLPASIYQRIDDIIIPSQNGTTQIDHIVVSPFGIFVVETKNMKGWIFGSEKGSKWTQCLTGLKTSFQNPLRQNYRHVQSLVAFLRLDAACFHSVVNFVGDCAFKTSLPANVVQGDLSAYIGTFTKVILEPGQISQVVNALTAVHENPAASPEEHVYSLNLRYASKTTCP